MGTFQEELAKLNDAQRAAVDQIDGPLLVIAGPGTGKTQLLSARVANILERTDAQPQNILCLTFTESGAANMRERLSRFIGKAAYDVQISTYHGFGSEIIASSRPYFVDDNLQQPVDTIGRYRIVHDILAALPYRDPLKSAEPRDVISTISDIKRGLLTSSDVRAIVEENDRTMQAVNAQLADIFADFARMPTKLDKALPYFTATLQALASSAPEQPVNPAYGSVVIIAAHELKEAVEAAEELGKGKPLTAWKNAWLEKDLENNFVLKGTFANKKLASMADVMDDYQRKLKEQGLYDFDDMILRPIHALKTNDELRYTLQEKYLYILLDEYQDTNRAQAELVHLLADNPVHEGRPNIMAVGDDDQAIYAFQGAQYSNMVDFYRAYRDTTVINLSHNYRSHADILQAGTFIAEQIGERVFHQFDGATKELVAANTGITQAHLERRDFQSDIAEYAWVAERVAALIGQGTDPNEIAILAPKHKYLETSVPLLQKAGVPIRYQRSENVLEAPVIRQILLIAQLLIAIDRDDGSAEPLWPEVLSFPFWELPTKLIWQLSWRVNDQYDQKRWAAWLLDHEDKRLQGIAQLLLQLASQQSIVNCELLLDQIIGSAPVEIPGDEGELLTSPLRAHYERIGDGALYDMTAYLSILREAIRARQRASGETFAIKDLLQLVADYELAGEKLPNTSPYNQASAAVQLMSAHTAKGLEFAHVFLLSVTNDIWGNAKGNNNMLALPANLAPVRHTGASEDERLRLLFVAITRAKHGLYMTSHEQTYSGKRTARLKYLDERERPDGSFYAYALPEPWRLVAHDDRDAPELEQLEAAWTEQHRITRNQDLVPLLRQRVADYQISPTDLGKFCDLAYAGPQQFYLSTILRFPTSSSAATAFGTAIHGALEFVQSATSKQGNVPELQLVLDHFERTLRGSHLTPDETQQLLERGISSLSAFMAERGHTFRPSDVAEQNFKHEGVFVGEAHLTGKIDRLEIDHEAKTIAVIDYKTGKPHARHSDSDAKLHKYRQQLYCYKLLIEGSHTYAGYRVTAGRLEFVEPDDAGTIHHIDYEFDAQQLEETSELIQAVYQHIIELNFPDTSGYAPRLPGIRTFEADLRSGKI